MYIKFKKEWWGGLTQLMLIQVRKTLEISKIPLPQVMGSRGEDAWMSYSSLWRMYLHPAKWMVERVNTTHIQMKWNTILPTCPPVGRNPKVRVSAFIRKSKSKVVKCLTNSCTVCECKVVIRVKKMAKFGVATHSTMQDPCSI